MRLWRASSRILILSVTRLSRLLRTLPILDNMIDISTHNSVHLLRNQYRMILYNTLTLDERLIIRLVTALKQNVHLSLRILSVRTLLIIISLLRGNRRILRKITLRLQLASINLISGRLSHYLVLLLHSALRQIWNRTATVTRRHRLMRLQHNSRTRNRLRIKRNRALLTRLNVRHRMRVALLRL